jgi:amino acid permease
MNEEIFYIIILALMILPLIFQKTVKELKIIAITLFVSVMFFILTLIIFASNYGA